jgi:hypothetical protein
MHTLNVKGKDKAIPLHAGTGPEGRTVPQPTAPPRAPHIECTLM